MISQEIQYQSDKIDKENLSMPSLEKCIYGHNVKCTPLHCSLDDVECKYDYKRIVAEKRKK